jgi:carbon-monoxide dehydrogenase small subunit
MTYTRIKLNVNHDEYSVDVRSHWNLLYVLRKKIGLTGVKYGCGTGECGACTVILNGKIVHSCLKLAVQCDGSEIITIEGVGIGSKLTSLQEAFVRHGAVQCGYCTPGMVLAAQSLLDENSRPTVEEVIEALRGNLCRCTGYHKIIEAIMDAASERWGCR